MSTIGDRLADRYRLDAVLGSGAFAAVFRAHDLRLDRDVAVKVLLANHATDALVAARFEREARVLAAVNHPNVVAIHDVAAGSPEGAEPFLVMDLCDGGSLADRLAASPTGSLTPDVLTPILIDIAAGLAALHAGGIVHRDLKPSNVLLSGGRAQIADLGIALAGPSDLTATGTTVGTLAYLTPEQLAGAPASPASDVHALGTIAFLGLTGRLPYPATSVASVVAASARPIDPVSTVVPSLGPAFDQPIARALALDPSARPGAAELGTALSGALASWRSRPGSPIARDAPTVAGLAAVPAADAANDPTTLVHIPVREPPRLATEEPDRRISRAVMVGALVAILVLAAAALLIARGSGTGLPPASVLISSPASSSTPTPSPSVAPSFEVSPSPSVAPTATPVDPYTAAQSASQAMRAAIAAARGPNGLKGKDANSLDDALGKFDQALNHQDAGQARDAANKVAGQVADLLDHGGIAAPAAARLQAAANRLVAAANALPE